MERSPAKKIYSGIDIAKFVFACFIPFLHIGFRDTFVIHVFRQYIARLGVPFFFAVTGMFISMEMNNGNKRMICKKYLKRIGILLLLWLLIYAYPIIVGLIANSRPIVRELIFLTPAYLWYLTAVLFAIIPFCLIKYRKSLYVVSAVLYIVGTLFGGSYSRLTGGMPGWYTDIFLTTRNGLFFALPFFCVGELVYKLNVGNKKAGSLLAVSSLFLLTEITLVQRFAGGGARL